MEKLSWTGLLAGILGLMLCEWARAVHIPSCFPPFLQDARHELITAVLSKTWQIPLVGALLLYHVWLLWIKNHGDSGTLQKQWKALAPADWFRLLLVLCAVVYFIAEWRMAPDTGDEGLFLFGVEQCTNLLVLLTGIVVGQFVRMTMPKEVWANRRFMRANLLTMVVSLAVLSFLQNGSADRFQYRGENRMTGLWVNPNTYGLLMGVGFLLALTYLAKRSSLMPQAHSLLNSLQHPGRRSISVGMTSVISVATTLLLVGLIRSYSRGAWVATASGCIYVFCTLRGRDGWKLIHVEIFGQPKKVADSIFSAIRAAGLRYGKWVVVAGCSLFAIILFDLSHLDHSLAKRVISSANVNDFSWRNRVIAVQGALQVLADHPVVGVGWRGASSQFEHYYAPVHLVDHWSIILNDYLTLATALGLPGLGAFIGLLWISWNGTGNRQYTGEIYSSSGSSEIFQTAFRGTVIIFLIGFWFDGGLFKLALGVPFWMFLECAFNNPK